MYTTSGLPQAPHHGGAHHHSPGSLIHERGSEPGDEVIRHAYSTLQGRRSRLATRSRSPLAKP
jgi:hypothetical protein